ncbi:MAG TPA: damage-inducible protein CinA, partial [Acidimicrobiaceae bacterium]|nr:damage-inducible protein CinA [Acidimicrobiaceae bacterium]
PGPGAPAGPTAVALAGADGVSPHALRLPGDVELQRRLATISAFNALRRTLEPAG